MRQTFLTAFLRTECCAFILILSLKKNELNEFSIIMKVLMLYRENSENNFWYFSASSSAEVTPTIWGRKNLLKEKKGK